MQWVFTVKRIWTIWSFICINHNCFPPFWILMSIGTNSDFKKIDCPKRLPRVNSKNLATQVMATKTFNIIYLNSFKNQQHFDNLQYTQMYAQETCIT